MTGQEAQLPIHIATQPTNKSNNPTAEAMLEQLHQDIELAKQCLQRAQQRQAAYANQHRREVVFNEGDQVLLSTRDITLPGGSPKLQPKYVGPFKIKRVVSSVAYELILPEAWRIHPVFHISKLKQYKDSSKEDFPLRATG